MKNLIIATKNQGKLKEFKNFLHSFQLSIFAQPNELEVDETGKSFMDNARLKAIAAAKYTSQIALADDSGLCVESLGGAPGVFSSRYANNDSERICKLLKELENIANRNAYFAASLCLSSPSGQILFEVEGRCHGVIVTEPRGKNGFGYDPVFEVNGTGLTFAEMDSQQKSSLSHRSNAFKLLLPKLKTLLD